MTRRSQFTIAGLMIAVAAIAASLGLALALGHSSDEALGYYKLAGVLAVLTWCGLVVSRSFPDAPPAEDEEERSWPKPEDYA